jgi:sugar transferase (PEP-CTERM system associated)
MATVFNQRISWRLALLVGSETLLIAGSIVAAAYIRGETFSATQNVWKALLPAGLCQLCLYYAELYDLRVLADRRVLFVRLLQSLGVASLILAALYFWFPSLVIGRGVFVIAIILVIALVIGWRTLFWWLAGRLGYGERLLLVGTGSATVLLARELYDRPDLGVHIVGFIDPDPAQIGTPMFNPGVIGTIEDIPSIVKQRAVDRVVVSLADARGRLPMESLLEMRLLGVKFDHLASVYEEYTGKIALENLRPSWLVFSHGFRKNAVVRVAKRLTDITVALIGFVLASVLMAIIAVAIRIVSPGPALFHQQRVGQNGKTFVLHKFRSMRPDAEALTGPVWASERDSRIFPLGRFLRKTRLDELPQLWNILRGDLSFVGPRPERPEFVEQLSQRIPFYGLRHVVKPGLTGWAQVSYSYGSSVEDAMEKLQCELFYIKNMTLALDLFIIFKTVQTVLLQRGT